MNQVISVTASSIYGEMGTTYFIASEQSKIVVKLLPIRTPTSKNLNFDGGSAEGWIFKGSPSSFEVVEITSKILEYHWTWLQIS
jgi:hypothetical protein